MHRDKLSSFQLTMCLVALPYHTEGSPVGDRYDGALQYSSLPAVEFPSGLRQPVRICNSVAKLSLLTSCENFDYEPGRGEKGKALEGVSPPDRK
jgi:hypothetical protein